MNGSARTFLLCLAGCMLLSGCGGGGGGGGSGASSAGTAPPPAPADADPGGIWYGFANNMTLGESYEVAGVSISSGELRFIDSQGVQYHGSMQVSGNSFTASIRAIAPLGGSFINGGTVLTGTLNGTISQRSSLQGSYLMSSGERGTVSLLYDNLYQRPSSMARVTGTWIDASTNTFSVDSSGRIFGQDSMGCVYSGNFRMIDTRYNAYRMDLDVSNCGAVNGSYSGLAAIDDWQANGDNRLLVLQLSNHVWSLTATLGKL